MRGPARHRWFGKAAGGQVRARMVGAQQRRAARVARGAAEGRRGLFELRLRVAADGPQRASCAAALAARAAQGTRRSSAPTAERTGLPARSLASAETARARTGFDRLSPNGERIVTAERTGLPVRSLSHCHSSARAVAGSAGAHSGNRGHSPALCRTSQLQ